MQAEKFGVWACRHEAKKSLSAISGPPNQIGVMNASVLLIGALASQLGIQTDLGPKSHALELGFSGGAFVAAGQGMVSGPSATDRSRAGLNFMLRLSYSPFTFIGVEAEAGHIALTSSGQQETSLYTLRGQVLAQYPAMISPFIVAGGGVLGVKASSQGASEESKPALHWGAGLKYYALPDVVARIEGRHTLAQGQDGALGHNFEILAGVAFTLASAGP